MQVFYCERCNTRLTDQDIERGEARDKKWNGMYCSQCAVGISTMESPPITQSQAVRILSREELDASSRIISDVPTRVSTPNQIRRKTSADVQGSSKSGKRDDSFDPSKSKRIVLWGIAALASIAVIGGLLLFIQSNRRAENASKARAKPKSSLETKAKKRPTRSEQKRKAQKQAPEKKTKSSRPRKRP